MEHLNAQPEQEGVQEARLFNTQAMTDEQITLLYRGLFDVETTTTEAGNVLSDMLDQVTNGLRDLASQDARRIKDLVAKLALSEHREYDEADWTLAADILPSLVDQDWGFTRDTLVFLITKRHIDAAKIVGRRLMREHLTPEQNIELETSLLTNDGAWFLGR